MEANKVACINCKHFRREAIDGRCARIDRCKYPDTKLVWDNINGMKQVYKYYDLSTKDQYYPNSTGTCDKYSPKLHIKILDGIKAVFKPKEKT